MIVSIIKNRHHQNGYTLIELLLVVTVIALIAALGVKMYRDKAESDRINIAALNIQHVLESGLSYNVTNSGLWPKDNSSCSASPADSEFVKNYLPNESNQSNFGSPLCWSGDDATFGPQLAKRFWVALNVGSDDAAANIAKRIASRLPNAIITSDPTTESSGNPTNNCDTGKACYVKAVVAIPSASSANKNYLAGAGYCDPSITATQVMQGKTIGANQAGTGAVCRRTMLTDQFGSKAAGFPNDLSLSQYEIEFQCKPNEAGSLYVTPNFTEMDRFQPSQPNKLVDPLIQLSVAPYNSGEGCNDPDVSGNVTCRVSIKATFGPGNGSSPADVGCTTDYQKQKICQCQPSQTTTPYQGVCVAATDNPKGLGGIGASYIAMCGVTKTSISLNQANTDRTAW